jgi:hypothetical protein
MAYDRAPLDGGDAKQKGQHGTFSGTSLGLERMRNRHVLEIFHWKVLEQVACDKQLASR